LQIFFEKLGIDAEVEVSFKEEENVIFVALKSSEAPLLTGEKGETLFHIQRLLNAIFKKKIGATGIYVDFDVNEYKKKKIKYLNELAQKAADDVALTKQEKILSPMFAYERRVVHLAISKREDVISESVGEEPKRQIIIKPKT